MSSRVSGAPEWTVEHGNGYGKLTGVCGLLPLVAGISAGSTLTAAFSVFNIGEEQQVADFAYSIIKDLNQSAIFRMWPGGFVQGLLQEASLFDSTPLRNLFTNVLADKTLSTDRVTCMGASDMNSGGFERFCQHDSIEALVNATISSAAIPGIFLHQTWGPDMKTYIDGGTLVNVDVLGAIEQCLSLGYSQSDIIVDTIECSGRNLTALTGDLAGLTTIPVFLRAGQMNSFAGKERDYEAALHAYPQVSFRYRIWPSTPISGSGIGQREWLRSHQLLLAFSRDRLSDRHF